jgi:GPH family glycoside/pentoside/hexuronide:cation symporter
MKADAPKTEVPDAPRKEVVLYAVGNIEGGLANQFFSILSVVTVVALGMNPLLIGLIISLKTLWDGITDPLMAQWTDQARTRWGRRIPFILVGGVSRVLLLLAIFLCFPRDASIKTNAQYQEEKVARTVATAPAKLAESPPAEAASIESAPDSAPAPEPAPEAPKPKPRKPSLWQQIGSGFAALTATEDSYHRTVFTYLLVAALLYALLSTVQSVPYYALGIEICPSYDGRTRVVTYRAFADQLMSLVAPWVLPFCFLPIFVTVIDGLVWYAVAVCVIGIPTTIAMCRVVKERLTSPAASSATSAPAASAKAPGPGLFRSMWITARNPHFLRILFLYVFIGFTNGIFAQVGTFLVLYWVFAGDVLGGSVVNGYAATIATLLGFASLPLVNWACRRYSKHAALRAAIVWMAIGAGLKWFFYNPSYPYLQLLLPFFFSVGIASVYTVLPSLMADVTDLDELETGVRREGMFGAVMAFLNKALSSLQPVLAAVVLLASGFDASLGADQPPEVFTRMRLMASWIPGGLLLFALVALWRYPITRGRLAEVKAILAARRAEARG